jgi:hypothetical protein
VNILKACRLQSYDERTDVREPGEPCDIATLSWLHGSLDRGEVRIEPGLIGWPPYNATAFVEAFSTVFHVEVEGLTEEAAPDAPIDRSTNLPRPAILTIAALFVTCPGCSHDAPISTPDGDTTAWSLDNLADYDGETDRTVLPRCPECGQPLTIRLPNSLPVNP